jgi:hypothetical protein
VTGPKLEVHIIQLVYASYQRRSMQRQPQISNRTAEMPYPENMRNGVAVGISLIAWLQAELCVLPVWILHIGFPVTFVGILDRTVEMFDPKSTGYSQWSFVDNLSTS